MTLNKIYQQLGWNVKYEDEVKKFNNRILLTVDNFYSKFYEGGDYKYIYPNLIKEFAFLLGESEYYGYGPESKYYLKLTRFFEGKGDAFLTNIKNLTLLLEAARKTLASSYNKYYKFLLDEIKKVFEITPVDIGYLFTGETIIKKGATELDEKLILENLTWLVSYPNTKQLFENSLKHYLTKHYQDAITNAYSSLESLELTEFYIYVTGTFIRLIIQKINSKSINT